MRGRRSPTVKVTHGQGLHHRYSTNAPGRRSEQAGQGRGERRRFKATLPRGTAMPFQVLTLENEVVSDALPDTRSHRAESEAPRQARCEHRQQQRQQANERAVAVSRRRLRSRPPTCHAVSKITAARRTCSNQRRRRKPGKMERRLRGTPASARWSCRNASRTRKNTSC